jgi:hypothetical protein
MTNVLVNLKLKMTDIPEMTYDIIVDLTHHLYHDLIIVL